MKKGVVIILVLCMVFLVSCGDKQDVPETTTEATTSIPKECDKPCPPDFVCDPDGICRVHSHILGNVTCWERGDNFADFYRKGYVIDTQQDLLEGEMWEDRCEGDTLIEYICLIGDNVGFVEQVCENGCEDGACKAIAD